MTAQLESTSNPTETPENTAANSHPIRSLLISRIGWGAFSVAAVAVIVYVSTLLLPGDAAQAILGQQANPDRLAVLRDELGLDQSAWAGFTDWFTGILQGDFGTSLATQQPVTEVIGPSLLNSAALVACAAVVATLVGVTLGAFVASRRDGMLDHAVGVLALIASALPEFIIGIFVVLIFAVNLKMFPAISVLDPGQHIWDEPSKMVLPVLTLTIVAVPYILRMCRGSVIEALDSDYVEVARLKGVSPQRVLFRHAMPNAMAPTIQVVGLTMLYFAGGIVLVESVFQFPGIGLALVDAISARDVPVIQALVLLLATCYVVLNLIADVAVLLVTPRRRLPR